MLQMVDNNPLRDTVWDGMRTSKLVTAEGTQKGLQSLLEERGVSIENDEMIKIGEEMNFKRPRLKK